MITNALILDHWGIVKADIGIRDGRIVGVGKAGNPDIMAGVTPGMVIGASTEVIAGEGRIVTAGGIDSHIHFICPQLVDEALAAGLTTLIGGGTGPATGTNATTCAPGAWNIHRMLEAAEACPINLGFLAKGNASRPEPLREQVEAGAIGLKLHEDWGTTPAAIDAALSVAEEMDIQVAIHTDTLNEAGFVEDSIRAFKGRTIHTYHTEGAGGGHAPDIIRVCGEAELPAVLDEPHDAVHREHHGRAPRHADGVPSPERRRSPRTSPSRNRASAPRPSPPRTCCTTWARSACCPPTRRRWAASPRSSSRTWQTADKMKTQRGALPGDGRHDNARAKRYVAKYTINPAISHGIAHEVGSIERGQARRPRDLEARVLRRQARAGAQGRPDRDRGHGRSERVHPHAPAGALPADVRLVRRRGVAPPR